MKRAIKVFHELGACGVMGAFAICIVLILTAPSPSYDLVAYAATRQSIAVTAKFILVPSLALVLISGLLAIAANRAYTDAGWAWLKALLGVSMFEGTLSTVVASARRAAELTSMAKFGDFDADELAKIMRAEWGGLWIMLALGVANIAIAVWRPRLFRHVPR